MRNILKNAETEHIDDLYGYFGEWNPNTNFAKIVPNGDGTYMDMMFNRKFFGDGLYYIEWADGREVGYRLLHETGPNVVFHMQTWSSGRPRIIEATGEEVIECDLDGNETATRYIKYVEEGDYITLFYPEDNPSGYCDVFSSASYIKVIKPISETEFLASIVPGVTYDGENVTYNVKTTQASVIVTPNGEESQVLEEFPYYSDFCYFEDSQFEAWTEEASSIPGWNAVRTNCYDWDDNRVSGKYGLPNGFFITPDIKRIEIEFYFMMLT